MGTSAQRYAARSRKGIVSVARKQRELNYSSRVIQPMSEYSPDDEFIAAARSDAMVRFDPTADVDSEGRPFEVSAHLFEASVDGKTYRLKRYDSKASLREAFARGSHLPTNIEPPRRLREARALPVDLDQAAEDVLARRLRMLREGDSFSSDQSYPNQNQSFSTGPQYGSGIDVSAEYVPMMAGPWSKQLYEQQYREMHSKAFEAYNHNPVAHQLCELQTAFVLGRGIDHQCTNQDVQEVWSEFVQRTHFYDDLENIATDLWWSGEMFMEFYDDTPQKGYTDYRMIDPSTILEIVTDPEDIQEVYYAHQQYSTMYQNYTSDTKQKVDAIRYIIRQIPAKNFQHVKLNVSKYEKRGRSDLFSVLGWVKRLKDLMNARVIKGQLEAAFVWDVEVESGAADVSKMALQLPDPYKAGSTFVHNKNIKLTPQSSSIKGNDQAPDVQQLLNLIAVGFGIPKEFIGESGKGAKAGALAATEPGTKRFEKRQRLIERICYAVADRVISNAIDAGRIKIAAIMPDARSVSKLSDAAEDMPVRSDVQDEMQDKQDEVDQQAQDVQEKSTQMAMDVHKQNMSLAKSTQKHQQSMEVLGAKQAHSQALAVAKNTSHSIKTTNTNTNVPDPANPAAPAVPMAGVQQTQQTTQKPTKVKESLRGVVNVREADDSDDSESLNSTQKKRVKTLKDTPDQLAREFLEFVFPAIAQEDRSAKLKDLALSEAMQWLPKSVAATLAAKELSITTYSFEDAWRQIVSESERGMSIAHVYAQDNTHVPQTTIAQDLQAEMAAKQPAPNQSFQNVPVPPPVTGDKLVPAGGPPGAPGAGGPPKPPGAGGGSVPPGQTPQSGSTKVNQYSGPAQVDPTAGSHGYSAAANSPFTAEGIAKAKESMSTTLARRLVRESMGSVIRSRQQLLESITANEARLAQLDG